DHRGLGLRRRSQDDLSEGLESAEAVHPDRAAAALTFKVWSEHLADDLRHLGRRKEPAAFRCGHCEARRDLNSATSLLTHQGLDDGDDVIASLCPDELFVDFGFNVGLEGSPEDFSVSIGTGTWPQSQLKPKIRRRQAKNGLSLKCGFPALRI